MKLNSPSIISASGSKASELVSIALAAILGIGIIWTVGMAQAASLHDAAHDVRHTTGFPCH
ncbi:CbtB domain-containing protein [Fulvimarina sp. MAC8]|uniref:CbtB domain-containing protein n=1 Tax=Fulvimarina sp. MAC8 TaxID=3162874 RepID=UPI0032EBF07F